MTTPQAQGPQPLTPEERAELLRLSSEATPGPWKADTPDHLPWTVWDESGDIAVCDIPRHTLANYREDASFIAAARTALPRALATIDRLEAEVATLKAERDHAAALLADNEEDVTVVYAERDRLQRDLDAAIQVLVDNDLSLADTLARPLKSAARIEELEAEVARLTADYPHGDQDSQVRAWAAVWQELERQGMLSFVTLAHGRDRAVTYIRHLGESRAQLRTDLSHCAARLAAAHDVIAARADREPERVRRLEARVVELEAALQQKGETA